MSSPVSRRSLIGGSGVALGAVATSRLIDPVSAQTPDASPSGGWTFTDDKGVTVSLDRMPTRIVAEVNAAAPLWDFGIRPIAVFGFNANDDKDFGPAGGNIDPELVEVVGDATEMFRFEDVIALSPDLIVTLSFAPEDPENYRGIEPDLVDRARQIAPIVAMSAAGRADLNTERFAELAAALGADLESDELIAAKERFETAKARLQGIASAKPDVVSIFTYEAPDEPTWLVASPPDWSDLTFYQSLGVNIVSPDVEPYAYWQELSIEEAGTHPADIFFHTSWEETMTPEQIQAHPTLGKRTEVAAGQLAPWYQDFIVSYQGMAELTEGIASVLERFNKIS